MDPRPEQAIAARPVDGFPSQIPDFGRRYELIAPIGHGAMGLVYRCLDRLVGREVALKHVRAPMRDLGAVRTAAANEFRMLASLRHDNIIAVRDFGFAQDTRQPYFTMDLVEPAEALLDAADSRSLVGRGQLLVQLLRALHYLHRRGVLHRDLKPSNILVSGDVVKLVDFGLSVLRSHACERSPSGSLAWMAPELLRGGVASDASDLYAVGVLAYEMFTGCHPYDVSTASTLYRSVLDGRYERAPLDAVVAPALVELVGGLLAPAPEDRPDDIAAMIRTVADALGFDAPTETSDSRDSFLEGAAFVGRAHELASLGALLDDAVEGAGSAVVVLGESGLGKSRLIDELRVAAMVADVCVLSGQAVSAGGAPWQVWLGVCRRLLIDAPGLDTIHRGILASLLPESRVGRVPDDLVAAPSASDCLMRESVHTAVLTALRELRGPTLLVLEDVHWAGRESLALLAAVARAALDEPLCVVVTCRSDEMPEALRAMQLERITLSRLARHEVLALTASMLGPIDAGDELIDRLMVETEGNPFFLVEILRSLAERAGRLTDVAHRDVPDALVPDGIQRIAMRQLGRLGPAATQLLELAAVCGRVVALDVLRRLDATADLCAWLSRCAEAGVLAPIGDDWWFAHDKIREAIVESLSPARRAQVHLEVAIAIEAGLRDPAARAAALAVHWHHAGDARAEARYRGMAGVEAACAGADAEAIDALQRALELTEALTARTPSLELDRAHWRIHLGRALLRSGRTGDARHQLETCAERLGLPVARRSAPSTLRTAMALLRARRSARADGLERLQLALEACDALVEVYQVTGRLGGMCLAALACYRLADLVGADDGASVRAAMGLSTVMSAMRQQRLADWFTARAWRDRDQPLDERTRMRLAELTALQCLQRGRWSEAELHYQELAERGRRLGVWRSWELANLALLWGEAYRGEQPVGWTAVLASATHRDDAALRAWTRFYMARSALDRGDHDDARALIDAGEACLVEASSEERARIAALRARLARHQEDWARVLRLSVTLLEHFTQQSLFRPWLSPVAWCAESLLDVLEFAPASTARDTLRWRHVARRACREVEVVAARMPIGRPAALRHRARLQALLGRHQRAQITWQRALAVAEGYEAWPERAIVMFERARLGGADADAGGRRGALEQAIEALERCGLCDAASQARALLDAD